MKISLTDIFKSKPGSALILTMFILAGMMVVAVSGAYIIVLGIKSSGLQSQSTKAYFAAESGAERALWELRKNNWSYYEEEVSSDNSLSKFDTELSSGASYKVYYTHNVKPIIFDSVGNYLRTKRSVQLRM